MAVSTFVPVFEPPDELLQAETRRAMIARNANESDNALRFPTSEDLGDKVEPI